MHFNLDMHPSEQSRARESNNLPNRKKQYAVRHNNRVRTSQRESYQRHKAKRNERAKEMYPSRREHRNKQRALRRAQLKPGSSVSRTSQPRPSTAAVDCNVCISTHSRAYNYCFVFVPVEDIITITDSDSVAVPMPDDFSPNDITPLIPNECTPEILHQGIALMECYNHNNDHCLHLPPVVPLAAFIFDPFLHLVVLCTDQAQY